MLEGATAPSRTPRKRGVGSVRTSVVHNAVPGRVRFRHAGLVAREELARKVETSLYAAVGVVSARASALTGSVLVSYALPATLQGLASAGTQSETIAVRSFSLSETRLLVLLAAEVGTALIVGLVLAALALPLIWLIFGDAMLGLAVAISLFFATAVATAVGVLLPWIFDRLGFDPALSSGPIATAFQDGATLLIYLSTAAALLG